MRDRGEDGSRGRGGVWALLSFFEKEVLVMCHGPAEGNFLFP